MDVGFFGGSDLRPVGPVEYFLEFYSSIKEFVDWKCAPHEKSRYFVCDRLYKRYVRDDEFELTVASMCYCFEILKNKSNCADTNFSTLHDKFLDAVENIRYLKCLRGSTNLLRIVIAEIPQCFLDTNRSLEKLDTWDGPPFWTRFYLKELMDQGKPLPELPF